MQSRAFGFPGRYVQGPGAIQQLPGLLKELQCTRVLVVVDNAVRQPVWEPVHEQLREPLQKNGLSLEILEFPGECTLVTIEALASQAGPADCVVGFGGGKTIDTAKGIALRRAARLIIAPTIASNDSPTSRLIVLYDEHHKVSGVHMLARNPDVVLVDTRIISRAPARFFAAGLGDALSKMDESAQCHQAGGNNFFGTPSLPLAQTLGHLCHDTIVEFGLAALQQIRAHHEPDANVEQAVEASVLLSGLAFESGGLSIAHALTRGFSAMPEMARFLHGEMVAFGSIVQKIVQHDAPEVIHGHAVLVRDLGLPVRFADFGGFSPDPAQLRTMAELCCQAPYIGNVRPAASLEIIMAALQRADELGRALGAAANRRDPDRSG